MGHITRQSEGSDKFMSKKSVQRFLNDNQRLREIRQKLINPQSSKTHQGNWSTSIAAKLGEMKQKIGQNAVHDFGSIPRPAEIPQ